VVSLILSTDNSSSSVVEVSEAEVVKVVVEVVVVEVAVIAVVLVMGENIGIQDQESGVGLNSERLLVKC